MSIQLPKTVKEKRASAVFTYIFKKSNIEILVERMENNVLKVKFKHNGVLYRYEGNGTMASLYSSARNKYLSMSLLGTTPEDCLAILEDRTPHLVWYDTEEELLCKTT